MIPLLSIVRDGCGGAVFTSLRRAAPPLAAMVWAVVCFTTSASGQSPAPEPGTTVAVPRAAPAEAGAADAPPVATDSAGDSGQAAAPSTAPTPTDRYQDGIVIWETPADASVPFLLKFNINTQLRYLNTMDSDETFTDHLGVTREVHRRNDITVNRAMFILGGYIFDQRARYSFTVWTSAGAASIIVASNIGWRFNDAHFRSNPRSTMAASSPWTISSNRKG